MWYNLVGDIMQIVSIKKQKNGFYKLVGHDESVMLADEVIINNNILFKKELSEEEINNYLKENYKYECLNKTYKFFKTKLRSKKEVKKYLSKFELNKNDYDFIISKLESQHLLDDNRYVEAYVYDRFNIYHDGVNKIKKDLLSHNISEDIIDKELSKIDYQDIYDKLEKLLIKKINHNTKYPKGEFKRKMELEFFNLGYEISMIDEIIDSNYKPLNEDVLIEKEAAKLINKYQNKYEPNKLKMTVKQKLYQKGYSIEMINEIINKKL